MKSKWTLFWMIWCGFHSAGCFGSACYAVVEGSIPYAVFFMVLVAINLFCLRFHVERYKSEKEEESK